jgi:glycine cleavage system T protein (aminomethyltransferase)
VSQGRLRASFDEAGADFVEVGGIEVPGTFGDRESEYRALRGKVGLSDLSHLAIVRATGDERLEFLQGILSQDLAPLEEPGALVTSLLLEPRGKVQFGLCVLSLPDELIMVTEPGRVDELIANVSRWRIRVRCELSAGNSSYGLLELRGPTAPSFPGAEWDWPGLPGRLQLVEAAELVERWRDLARQVSPTGWDAREAVRVEAGVPRIGPGLDVDERTIPQEAFLDRTMVSFTKGCFLGQELVCRIDSRGHVNRYLRGVVVSGSIPPPYGADIVKDEAIVGDVRSVAESLELGAPVCLGYVRREVEPPQAVTLRWEGGQVAGEVRELPLIG